MSLGLARRGALIATGVGAVGSELLMLRSAESTPPLLIVSFTGWVLSPFVALAWANRAAVRWPALTQRALYGVTFVVTALSLAIYGNALARPAGSSAAFYFVVVAPVSWALIALAVSIPVWISRRRVPPA